jgi:glycine cleavage system transcriptional repressor
MTRQVALSAIGRDQPGIVAALSKALFEQGCNLEESSMTRLKGEFAILLLVTLPAGQTASALEAAVQPAARALGLTLLCRELTPEEMTAEDDSKTLPYTLVVYGADRPGIVYRVTAAAAQHEANITDLRTRVTSGGGGQLVYSLIMEVELPDAATAGRFAADLEALKGELAVETTLTAVEADEL